MDEEPKDWEPIQDEDPPEKLKRKWIEEEFVPKDPVRCKSCQKFVPASNLACLFCGATIEHVDAGFLTRLLFWFKKLFR